MLIGYYIRIFFLGLLFLMHANIEEYIMSCIYSGVVEHSTYLKQLETFTIEDANNFFKIKFNLCENPAEYSVLNEFSLQKDNVNSLSFILKKLNNLTFVLKSCMFFFNFVTYTKMILSFFLVLEFLFLELFKKSYMKFFKNEFFFFGYVFLIFQLILFLSLFYFYFFYSLKYTKFLGIMLLNFLCFCLMVILIINFDDI